jgi:hypothetical protein
MTDTVSDTTPVAAATAIVFSFAGLPDTSFDCATIPSDARLDLLKSAAKDYIRNRVNATAQRYAKDESVLAWNAYDEATKADPLQTAVAKPEGERPAPADLAGALARALDDLTKGEIRRKSADPKPRAKADPLIAMVTKAVARDVYEARKASDPKYSYLLAQKEVGGDGVAYLNRMIDAKVEAGADRAPLEKMREEKYIKPARIMLGLDTNKSVKDLPSIL